MIEVILFYMFASIGLAGFSFFAAWWISSKLSDFLDN